MSVFSKRTAITLSCAATLATLAAAPAVAGVIAPTEKQAVTTGSSLDDIYYRYGWCRHHHHYYHHYWGWGYPVYSYPVYGWGWGWGWGGWPWFW